MAPSFDLGSDDILCSYDDYTNQDSSNGPNSDPAIAATNSIKEESGLMGDKLDEMATEEQLMELTMELRAFAASQADLLKAVQRANDLMKAVQRANQLIALLFESVGIECQLGGRSGVVREIPVGPSVLKPEEGGGRSKLIRQGLASVLPEAERDTSLSRQVQSGTTEISKPIINSNSIIFTITRASRLWYIPFCFGLILLYWN